MKVARILRDETKLIKVGMSMQEVLAIGDAVAEAMIEPPITLFRFENDDKWYHGRLQYLVTEADPDLIQQTLEEQEDE